MIRVTRLGGRAIYLNSDLIETIESAPDTTLLLTTGNRVIVQEDADEVVRRVVDFRRRATAVPSPTPPPDDDDRDGIDRIDYAGGIKGRRTSHG